MNEIIEYIRKSGRRPNHDDTGKIITKGCGVGRQKKGVMYCGPVDFDTNKVVVGFSLCSNLDKYDYVNGKYEKGFGLDLAIARAEKWKNHTGFFVQKSWNEKELELEMNLFMFENSDPKTIVEIPPSLIQSLRKFVARCKQYYKDKEFPEWVENLLDENPEIELYKFEI